MDGWKTSFLLGWPIFRCYVSFREGKLRGYCTKHVFFLLLIQSLCLVGGSSFDATGKVKAIEAGIPSLKLAAAS